jgi:hypothetical protein
MGEKEVKIGIKISFNSSILEKQIGKVLSWVINGKCIGSYNPHPHHEIVYQHAFTDIVF